MRISEGAEAISEHLHTNIVNLIIGRILKRVQDGETYILTAQDKWQIEVLQESGYLLEEIKKEIAARTRLQEIEIAEAFEEAGVKALAYDDAIYKKAGLSPFPLWESPHMVRVMQMNYEATMGSWNNFTRTIAEESQKLFISEMDRIYTEVTSGAKSYTQAFREAINNLASDGVYVYYPSGHRDTVETAALRCVRTGVGQMSSQIQLVRMKEYGYQLVLTSSHMGARPSHQEWQGKVFYVDWAKMPKDYSMQDIPMPQTNLDYKGKYPDFIESTRYGKVDGLSGANCRHSFSVYTEDMDNPFEDYDSEENRKKYEQEQRQRGLERRIRNTKRETMNLKNAVESCKDEKIKFALDMDYQRKAALLQKQNRAYKEYCKENGLKELQERLAVAKWDRQQAAAARGAAQRYKNAKGD